MADMFVSLVALVPKPSTVTLPGPKSGNTTFTGVGLQNQQVQTPGK